MNTYLINPLAILITLSTTLGVLMHDTQLDRAASVALALPAAAIVYGAADAALKSSDGHTHVERASALKNINVLRELSPRIQPRDDDRRYIVNKKIYVGGNDSISLWPSV